MFKSLKIIKLSLTKNLCKALKRGQPWVYADALESTSNIKNVCICKLFYKKDQVAWGFIDPHSTLRVRVLSTQKNWSFSEGASQLASLMDEKKASFDSDKNNSYRVVNGEGDFFPGLVCDKYSDIAVLQSDGEGPYQVYDWEKTAQICQKHLGVKYVYFKARNQHQAKSQFLLGETTSPKIFLENEMKFEIDFIDGQKTGFFIDQRENRKYLRSISKNKKVLNLFSYTGGFSVAAGLGGASEVTSLDISGPATQAAIRNWKLNELDPLKHKAVAENVFDFLDKNQESKFDIVICDPPSFSNNEKDKSKALKAYHDVFSKAAKLVSDKGELVLSSCSSHIDYEDFYQIAEEVLSSVRKKGKIKYVGHQASCHSYPLAFRKMQYLKFLTIQLLA